MLLELKDEEDKDELLLELLLMLESEEELLLLLLLLRDELLAVVGSKPRKVRLALKGSPVSGLSPSTVKRQSSRRARGRDSSTVALFGSSREISLIVTRPPQETIATSSSSNDASSMSLLKFTWIIVGDRATIEVMRARVPVLRQSSSYRRF